MKRAWPLIALGLAAYLLMLIIQLPAGQAWNLAKPYLQGAPIDLHGLQGSVWRGSARQVMVQGHGPMRVDWRLSPGALLRGRLSADVQVHISEGGQLQGRLHQAFHSHSLTLEAMSGQLAMPWLAGHIPNLPVQVRGTLGLRIEQMQIDTHKGWPETLIGQLHWYQAGIVMGDTLDLGDLSAQLSVDGDALLVNVSDHGGPLRTEVHVNLDDSGRYRIQGRLATTEQAAPALGGLLSLLGPADATGWHHLQWQGRTP